MEQVSYWKTSDHTDAKLTHDKNGSLIMPMQDEKYPLTIFPRGYLLFGPLSKLKHEIKNQIFNDSWHKLENGESPEEIVRELRKTAFPNIFQILETMRYDLIPYDVMNESIREIHRAWPKGKNSERWRDILCLILGEDDSYQFRLKFLAERFCRYRWLIRDPAERLERAFGIIEHAEVIDDMKERERLWARGCLMLLKDPHIRSQFNLFCKNVNWKKLKMTKGDKYHFRGKYFRVDMDILEY